MLRVMVVEITQKVIVEMTQKLVMEIVNLKSDLFLQSSHKREVLVMKDDLFKEMEYDFFFFNSFIILS